MTGVTGSMMTARCRFQRRRVEPDIYGNVNDGQWVDMFTVFGDLRLGSGREVEQGGRSDGVVAATLKVRDSRATRGVTAADRVVIEGQEFAIRAAVRPPRSATIDMRLELGGFD